MYAPYKTADLATSEFFIEPWRLYLQKAADLIRKNGLAKKALQDGDGRMCVHGAISAAISGHAYDGTELSRDVVHRFSQYLHGKGVPIEGTSNYNYGKLQHWQEPRSLVTTLAPWGWNNAAERTAEDVIAALEGAARS